MNAAVAEVKRFAQCSCGEIRESSPDLAFFEFRGEGSYEATETCRCGYHRVAHPEFHDCATHSVTCPDGHIECPKFEARGPREYDLFYCGHMGWD